jgi:histidyl-tRNA synthetase
MCSRLWRRLGLTDVTLDLNSLGDAGARARYRERLVHYLGQHEKQLDADSKRRMSANPLRVLDSKNPEMQDIIQKAPRLADDLDDASRKSFEDLQQLLRAAGVAYRINPRLVRGLDYYNGAVYEWVSKGLGAQNAVCAGGRYDGLVEQIGGKPALACGFAMGIERLLELVKAAGSDRTTALDAYLLSQGTTAPRFAFTAAEQLRERGITVTLDLSGASFKSQMKKADASGARFAVIVGDDEAAANAVSVKPLREDAQQVRVSVDEAVRLIKKT